MDTIEPHALIGTWRRFGPTGPAYEVVAIGEPADRDRLVRIRLAETGEETDYPLNRLVDDELLAVNPR